MSTIPTLPPKATDQGDFLRRVLISVAVITQFILYGFLARM